MIYIHTMEYQETVNRNEEALTDGKISKLYYQFIYMYRVLPTV